MKLFINTLDMLPSPFDWVEIPAGKVTLSKGVDDNAHSVGQAFDVPAFAIAKYPITNAQYAKFIEAGGYKQKKWWTEAGWETRDGKKWAEPRYWGDSKWNSAEQPVVGVSWYEAAAFCQWLSEATDDKIMLPSEQQWQRAAQADDDRAYPWGNDWDAGRCNNNVDGKGIGKTTPVTHYQGKGDSPFGVVDMAGNVWEWCLTAYQTGSQVVNGTDVRVLRGGSWDYYMSYAFCAAFRYWHNPNYGLLDWGFRLARSLG